MAEEVIVADTDWKKQQDVAELVDGLTDGLGDKLRAVVVYGPAVRGEAGAGRQEVHVLVLLGDLESDTLTAAGPALAKWVGRGLAVPRMFSPTTLSEATDVFPIELSDVAERHVVVHGRDPLASMPEIDGEHLRLQCERELREKLMRLEEAFALARGKESDLRRLLAASFPAFSMIFRGCLRLHGDPIPTDGTAAAAAFCERASIDPEPFAAVERLRRGDRALSATTLFPRYHAAICRAVDAIDKFVPHTRTRSQSA
jgi:hypothetical protein